MSYFKEPKLYLVTNPEIQDTHLGVISREGVVNLRVSDLTRLGLDVVEVPDFKPGTFVELEKENN